MNRPLLLFVLAVLPSLAFAQELNVALTVDVAKPGAPLRPIYRYFGYDEPNYTYMKDGKKLLKELGDIAPKAVHVRVHNLFTTGDGTPALKWGSTNIYTEDERGNPVYDWTIADRIVETFLATGTKPYMQLGFMPKALSTKPEPYQHKWAPAAKYDEIYTGWAYPPKDYKKWGDLCYEWTKHCVEKYGRAEVESWYWEVWNEPNIGYWRGTPQEYHKLYDFAIDGVRRALPTAKVGGPHIAGAGSRGGEKFLRDFLEHCVRGTNYATGKPGSPIDFIGFHAKGAPRMAEGHVRMGIRNQINDIDNGCKVVASFPELKDKPIIVGESDPDGCAACTARVYPQNAYRNTPLYASYTAASFARKHDIAAKHGVNLEGAVTWAFEFEDQPYFDGFRVLATNGVNLPVMNVFRMFGKMNGRRLPVTNPGEISLESIRTTGVSKQADVHALATLDDKNKTVAVMVWHYHDDDVAGPEANITLTLAGLPADAASAGNLQVQQYRIDRDHSNPFEIWKKMGSPQKPTDEQYQTLEKAGQLAELGKVEQVPVGDGKSTLKLTLPRQAVSLFVATW